MRLINAKPKAAPPRNPPAPSVSKSLRRLAVAIQIFDHAPNHLVS